MESFAARKIIEWGSTKAYFDFFDNFLDDLLIRDRHDPELVNARLHWLPSYGCATCIKVIGELSEYHLQVFDDVRSIRPFKVHAKVQEVDK